MLTRPEHHGITPYIYEHIKLQLQQKLYTRPLFLFPIARCFKNKELRGVETPKSALERSEIQKEITDLTIKMNGASEQLETEEKSIG